MLRILSAELVVFRRLGWAECASVPSTRHSVVLYLPLLEHFSTVATTRCVFQTCLFSSSGVTTDTFNDACELSAVLS
ncbi:hypothetical protein EDD16DRAFT_1633113 [Pisolithus croceorrhizus]|nr:hypothetical protein EV401DRAFT_2017305 [Pisolithus croceorrhizus]KAI6104804.1 hypothetical protein EV401DRAFT_2015805 [Pisolithus croceorrhizus]KAI6105276.1 hypothetical protein EDD16DRAFT_1633113 [Pisolithus croceorrhizus]KAI6139841.1 hypothetical protein EDD17DRAFT_1670921 [Pisolithus thermaeus]